MDTIQPESMLVKIERWFYQIKPRKKREMLYSYFSLAKVLPAI